MFFIMSFIMFSPAAEPNTRPRVLVQAGGKRADAALPRNGASSVFPAGLGSYTTFPIGRTRISMSRDTGAYEKVAFKKQS